MPAFASYPRARDRRVALSRALGVVPAPRVHRVRDRYVGATGWKRTAMRGVANVLRHRTLDPLAEFTLPGEQQHKFSAVDSRLVRLLYWYGDDG